MGYFVIEFVSDAYTLHYYTTRYRQISSDGEIFFKEQFLSFTQENKNWYWYQKQHQQILIVTTQNIVHLFLGFMAVKTVHYIPRSVCNKNETKKA